MDNNIKKIHLAQIGLGHWGPNLLRNFYDHPSVTMDVVCDISPDKQKKVEQFGVPFTTDFGSILDVDNPLDGVVIATPLATHYDLVKKALLAGKHVFVEKPLAADVEKSAELVDLANKKNLILMVGHIFIFNAGIRYVKTLVDSGDLGKILFIHGQRTNLGPIRTDANALWDLASHDISIFNYWLNSAPVSVTASGRRILSKNLEDIASANFYYPNGVCCHILASWLHPQKVRQITIVGDKKMAIWDDMATGRPVTIYDSTVKHVMSEQVEGTFAEFNFLIQEGDIHIPKIKLHEPLKAECTHFVECLLNKSKPITDGKNGLDVVCALEAADKSIKNGSAMENIGNNIVD